MKKYKTWEVVKMLTENPNLQFKNAKGEQLVLGSAKLNKDKIMCPKTFSCYLSFNVNTEWELVQQPISFMEAVKAYSEGKDVEIEKDGLRYDWNGVIHRESLPRTKWYIKEESTNE